MATTEPVAGRIFARPKSVIHLHWFNAICWFLMTASGLGIVRGDGVRLAPAFWSEFMQNLFGGNANLILVHSILAMIWGGVMALFAIIYWRSVTWPFLKKILPIGGFFGWRSGQSKFWSFIGGIFDAAIQVLLDLWFMVVAIAQLFGLMKKTKLAPVGRYNGAQRLLGAMIIACAIIALITGLTMFFGPMVGIAPVIFRWSLMLHALCVGFVWIGLVAHIYFALVEEPESLEAMKSGYLDEDFVKHHNPGWYAELKKKGE